MSYSKPPIQLGLNHPKNYLGFVLAFSNASSGSETKELLEEYSIVNDYEKAKNGAVELGYLTTEDSEYVLTERGKAIEQLVNEEYGSVQRGLESLGELYRSPKRFVEVRPEWEEFLQDSILALPPTERLIGGIQEVLTERVAPAEELELPIMFGELYCNDPKFALALFLNSENRDRYKDLSLNADDIRGTLPEKLFEPRNYFSKTIFQLKTFLWHGGLLTTKGKEASKLRPEHKHYFWGLDPDFQPEIINERPEKADHDERSVDFTTPDRTQTRTSRIIRNTALVNDLKKDHDYVCQVCGEKRYRNQGVGYAEGHHLRPLGNPHDGPDIESNILILCPTCHADADYGMLKFDITSSEVVHKYDSSKDGCELRNVAGHEVATRFLEYHNNRVAEF